VTQPRTSTRPLAPLKGGPHGAVTLAGLLRTTRPSESNLDSQATDCKCWRDLSHSAIRFQLANVWVTK
jgi:hypothetical protein